MANYSELFPNRPTFRGDGTDATGAGATATWAEGNNLDTFPFTKIPSIQIGEVHSFDFTTTAGVNTLNTALVQLYAVDNVVYNSGDVAIFTYTDTDDNVQTSTYLYDPDANSRGPDYEDITNADDWTQINFAAFSVNRIVTGPGIEGDAEVGAVTLTARNKIQFQGTDVNDTVSLLPDNTDDGKVIENINFTGNAVTGITREGHVYNIGIDQARIALSEIFGSTETDIIQTVDNIVVTRTAADTVSHIQFFGPDGNSPNYPLAGMVAPSTRYILTFSPALLNLDRVAANERATAYENSLSVTVGELTRTGEGIVSSAGDPDDAFSASGTIALAGAYEWVGTFDTTTMNVPQPFDDYSDSDTAIGETDRTPQWSPMGTIIPRERFLEVTLNDNVTPASDEEPGYTIETVATVTAADGTVTRFPRVGNVVRMTGVRGESWSITSTVTLSDPDRFEFTTMPTNLSMTGNWIGDTDQTDYDLGTHNFGGVVESSSRINTVNITAAETTTDAEGNFIIPFDIVGTVSIEFTLAFSPATFGFNVQDNIRLRAADGTLSPPPTNGIFTMPATAAPGDTTPTGFSRFLGAIIIPGTVEDADIVNITLTATVRATSATTSAIYRERRRQEFAQGNLLASAQNVVTEIMGVNNFVWRVIPTQGTAPYSVSLYREDPRTVEVSGFGALWVGFNGTYNRILNIDDFPNPDGVTIGAGFNPTSDAADSTIVEHSFVYTRSAGANTYYLWNRFDTNTNRGGWHLSMSDVTGATTPWIYDITAISTPLQERTINQVTSWAQVQGFASTITAPTVTTAGTAAQTDLIDTATIAATGGTGNVGNVPLNTLPNDGNGEFEFWVELTDSDNVHPQDALTMRVDARFNAPDIAFNVPQIYWGREINAGPGLGQRDVGTFILSNTVDSEGDAIGVSLTTNRTMAPTSVAAGNVYQIASAGVLPPTTVVEVASTEGFSNSLASVDAGRTFNPDAPYEWTFLAEPLDLPISDPSPFAAHWVEFNATNFANAGGFGADNVTLGVPYRPVFGTTPSASHVIPTNFSTTLRPFDYGVRIYGIYYQDVTGTQNNIGHPQSATISFPAIDYNEPLAAGVFRNTVTAVSTNSTASFPTPRVNATGIDVDGNAATQPWQAGNTYSFFGYMCNNTDPTAAGAICLASPVVTITI